jgi:hypothetical protein
MSKYGNHKVIIDGYSFDSIKERNRYLELKLLEKAKVISELGLQTPFVLLEKLPPTELNSGEMAVYYKADFTYLENGIKVIEDVKSKGTVTDVYIIKRKLVKKLYPEYQFREEF